MNEPLTSPAAHLDDDSTAEPGADTAEPGDAPANPATADVDLAAIERDLTDVQTALDRLNDGSYWTDEVTGEPIADDVLAAHPTARTATPTLD